MPGYLVSPPAPRPMFPHAVDSSMLATFRACPQSFFRKYMQHWKPKGQSVHLVAGGAFAAGLEKTREAFYIQGLPAEESISIGLEALLEHYGDFECPSDSAKSPERMAGALEFYFSQYPLEDGSLTPIELAGGKRGIEFSFAEPLDIRHPVTGNPILYTGRADLIGHYAGGIYICDEKTTSSLGPTWSRKWDMRSQFTGYTWASEKAGLKVDGILVRGVSILKTKYETQQALTYRPAWEIERWMTQVVRNITDMMRMWDEGFFDFNLDDSCESYGGCPLKTVCRSQTPEQWLPMYFEQKVWDPLAREEMTVEQFEAKWGHVSGA